MADISPESAEPNALELELVDEVDDVAEAERDVKSEELCKLKIDMTEDFLSPGSLNQGPLSPI
jgi:hypothetical protein